MKKLRPCLLAFSPYLRVGDPPQYYGRNKLMFVYFFNAGLHALGLLEYKHKSRCSANLILRQVFTGAGATSKTV